MLSSEHDVASRRAGSGFRCMTAYVEPPTIGQCTNLFTRPVQIRACVSQESDVQAMVRREGEHGGCEDTLQAAQARTKLSASDLNTFVNVAQSFVNQQCSLM
eukprot:758573-Hanusia_phi.AAC.11